MVTDAIFQSGETHNVTNDSDDSITIDIDVAQQPSVEKLSSSSVLVHQDEEDDNHGALYKKRKKKKENVRLLIHHHDNDYHNHSDYEDDGSGIHDHEDHHHHYSHSEIITLGGDIHSEGHFSDVASTTSTDAGAPQTLPNESFLSVNGRNSKHASTRTNRSLSSSSVTHSFASIANKRNVILPSEYQAIKSVAIQKMKRQRMAKLAAWKDRARRARDGLTSSLSMENLKGLSSSLSLDNLSSGWASDDEAKGEDDSTRNKLTRFMKRLCFACWWNLDPPANTDTHKSVNDGSNGGASALNTGGGSSGMVSSPSLGDLSLKTSVSSEKLYDVNRNEINEVKSIIIDLGYALSIYGMTSYRLEYHLSLIASYYGLICTAYSTPTGLWIYFGSSIDDPDRSSHFVKITSASLNLSKLCQLDDVAERISRGGCSIKEARYLITDILEKQSEYSHFIFRIITCFIQAGMWSVIFGANWGEMVASFVAGLCIGSVGALSSKFEVLGQVHTITSGVIAGIIGILFKILLRDTIAISVFLVSLSGVVSLLPGLTFTLAIAELSVRHLMSGSQRIMHGFVTIIQLGFGILISDRLGKFVMGYITALPEMTTASRVSPPIYILALTIPVVTSTTIVNFKAPRYPLALFFIFLDAFCGYFTSYFSAMFLGREVGTLLGAFMIGMVANVFGWISRHPSIIVASCGIIYLVPGSFGIRSIGAFLQKDSDGGLSFIMDTFSTCISLTVGLLLADILATKNKKKKLQL